MADPNWAKILHTVYEEEEAAIIRPYSDVQESYVLRSETGLGESEVLRAIEYLERQGLTEREQFWEDESDEIISLTEKGFDVAHERQIQKEQQSLIETQNNAIRNQSKATDTLANFTIILGAAALIQAFAAVVSAPRYNGFLLATYFALLIVLWVKRDEWSHGE